MLENYWHVLNESNDPESCILCLPGRAGTGQRFANEYQDTELNKTLIIGVTPIKFAWYPMPNGPHDQRAALSGLPRAVHTVESVLKEIEEYYKIPRHKTAVVGFSAGAVVALQLPMYSKRPLAGIVAHAGAVLDTNNVPMCKNSTPILTIHSKQDDCFEWEERYLPMKAALLNANYNLKTIEKEYGYHIVSYYDLIMAGCFLSKHLGYPNHWQHSALEKLNKKRA